MSVRRFCLSVVIHHNKIFDLGKRTLKNVVRQVDAKIDEYRTNLARLRDNFLAGTAVITGGAVLELLESGA
jgi:hypothetical protein